MMTKLKSRKASMLVFVMIIGLIVSTFAVSFSTFGVCSDGGAVLDRVALDPTAHRAPLLAAQQDGRQRQQ